MWPQHDASLVISSICLLLDRTDPSSPSVCVSSWVFRMVAGCEDSSSRQQQSWRWRAPQSQPSCTWTRAWLWPASRSSACCWWQWSSAAPRSSWTRTAPSPPPHGRNNTWMTDTLHPTCTTCIHVFPQETIHDVSALSLQKKLKVMSPQFQFPKTNTHILSFSRTTSEHFSYSKMMKKHFRLHVCSWHNISLALIPIVKLFSMVPAWRIISWHFFNSISVNMLWKGSIWYQRPLCSGTMQNIFIQSGEIHTIRHELESYTFCKMYIRRTYNIYWHVKTASSTHGVKRRRKLQLKLQSKAQKLFVST